MGYALISKQQNFQKPRHWGDMPILQVRASRLRLTLAYFVSTKIYSKFKILMIKRQQSEQCKSIMLSLESQKLPTNDYERHKILRPLKPLKGRTLSFWCLGLGAPYLIRFLALHVDSEHWSGLEERTRNLVASPLTTRELNLPSSTQSLLIIRIIFPDFR